MTDVVTWVAVAGVWCLSVFAVVQIILLIVAAARERAAVRRFARAVDQWERDQRG